VNIFGWGNTCLWGIGHYVKENEIFENIWSNWGQVVLFNKVIINSFFEYLIGWFTYKKEPLGCKKCNEMSFFYPTSKIP
jgi:hypothetical protein